MTAKIISIYTTISILIIAFVVKDIFTYRENIFPEKCSTSVNLKYVPDNEKEITAYIDFWMHTLDGELLIHELGKFVSANNNYVVDRVITYKITAKKDMYEIKNKRVKKNVRDTLPDAIYNDLTAKEGMISMTNVKDNIWVMSDLKKAILICSGY